MTTHSSVLAWRIPGSGEPGGLPSSTFMHWRRNGNPLQCSCLENPRDGGLGGAWWAAVYGVTQSRMRLKRLSSSSSIEKVVHCDFLLFAESSHKSQLPSLTIRKSLKVFNFLSLQVYFLFNVRLVIFEIPWIWVSLTEEKLPMIISASLA